jgi:hypothetical protein
LVTFVPLPINIFIVSNLVHFKHFLKIKPTGVLALKTKT